jgi:thioester reductase-like protein
VAPDADWRELLRRARERPPGPEPGSPRAILLTGATSFLGARLLVELLGRTAADVYCLVRASDAAAARERLPSAPRVVPVCGDIDRPLLGLSEAAWDRLAATIDTVYHCAARVNVVLPYHDLRATNVLGTREVLRLLATGLRKRLHYASTLSVFVATDRNAGLLEEADDLTRTCRVYGGYAQSKWAAEWLLRSVAGDVAPVRFYRFGLITGDTRTGRCSPTDFLALFCKGLAALSCVPEGAGGLKLDVTPVDFAAASMAHLSLHATAGGPSTFHIANPRGLALGELIDAMRSYGIAVGTVGEGEWSARLRAFGETARGAAESAAYLALCRALPGDTAFARQRTLDLFQATGVEFGMGNTVAGLAGSGIACPPPGPDLLRTYLAHIFREGLDGGRGAAGRPQ